MRYLTAAVLLFLPTLVSAQRHRPDVATIEKVADSIAAEVLKAPVAGIAVGVAHAGDVIFTAAYGLADVAERTPLRMDDAHQIGSLTKQFTAAAVLQLIEQGRMSLDDPIRKYLPDFDTQGRTVTIHHLLNHTSGIRSYTSIYGMNAVPREAVLDTIQKHPYDFEPGERYLYNNSGYYLLGVILEEVTGEPYAQYVEQRLFEPLGLTATSYCGYEGERVPVGYGPGPQGLATTLLSDMQFPGAAGALCSTVADLLRWQHALVTGQVVQPESYERMTTPAALASGETMNYGYGLMRMTLEDRTVVAHGGGIPGFNTFLSWHPTDSIGVVVLVNTTPGHTAQIHEPIARAALGLARRVVQDLPLDSAQRARYVGTYQLPSLEVRVFDSDGVLMTQATGQGVLRMKYQGDDTFLLDTPQEIRLVFQLEGEQAGGFTLYQGGATVPARRIRDDP